jgi:hypothetical protein
MVDFIKRNKALAAVAGLVLLGWLFTSMGSPAHRDLSAGPAPSPTGILIIFVLVFGLIGLAVWSHQRTARALDAAFKRGYRPPIPWMQNGKSLLSQELIETRSAMPPFILWYEQGQHDGTKYPGRAIWVSAIDGNRRLGPVDDSMPVYLQTSFKDEEKRIRLFRITAEAARQLTTGPIGDRQIPAVEHPSNRQMTVFVQGGTPGAMLPQAPRPIETRTTQGSSRAGTGDADAERA